MREEGKEGRKEADSTLKSNNPNLKGGEQLNILMQSNCLGPQNSYPAELELIKTYKKLVFPGGSASRPAGFHNSLG